MEAIGFQSLSPIDFSISALAEFGEKNCESLL